MGLQNLTCVLVLLTLLPLMGFGSPISQKDDERPQLTELFDKYPVRESQLVTNHNNGVDEEYPENNMESFENGLEEEIPEGYIEGSQGTDEEEFPETNTEDSEGTGIEEYPGTNTEEESLQHLADRSNTNNLQFYNQGLYPGITQIPNWFHVNVDLNGTQLVDQAFKHGSELVKKAVKFSYNNGKKTANYMGKQVKKFFTKDKARVSDSEYENNHSTKRGERRKNNRRKEIPSKENNSNIETSPRDTTKETRKNSSTLTGREITGFRNDRYNQNTPPKKRPTNPKFATKPPKSLIKDSQKQAPKTEKSQKKKEKPQKKNKLRRG